MGFPCCMGLGTGVRIAAVLSLLLGVGLCFFSGWLLKETYDTRESDSQKVANAVGGGFNTVFNAIGGEGKAVDVDKELRIKLALSATVFGAGALQCITSLLLICCSGTKGGRSTGKLYVFINTWGMIAIVAAIACVFTSKLDYENDQRIKQFLGASAVDFIFQLYFLCVAGAFVRS